MMNTVRVWDLPTRLFHWALMLCVAGLLITGNIGGNWMTWHFRLGYAVLTLLLFRLVWGFVGGYWSRFSSFLYSPVTVWRYLRGQGLPEHGVGHSPIGALSVWAMLLLLLAQVGTGLFSDDEIAYFGPLVSLVSSEVVSQATTYHRQWGKFFVLGLIVLHLLAIAVYQLVLKRTLVKPMVVGNKQLPESHPSAQDNSRTRLLALVVLGLCAVAVNRLIALGNTPTF
ncbi:MAG: hypothetical protein RLZZ352_1238 [Pseudomonadota bacterium]|jgi:cytochrome b